MKKNKCQCGCCEIVKSGRRYIRGHNRRRVSLSDEHKKKIGSANRGKKRSEKTLKKMRKMRRTAGLSLQAFFCEVFEQNEQQQLPDKLLQKRLIKEFPNSKQHNVLVNCFRGSYNRGVFGKPKIISMCYGDDGITRAVREEGNRELSKIQKGNKHGKGNKGKKLSSEARQKMSMAAEGKKLSSETRQKISKAGKGKKRSLETRQKISVAVKNRKPPSPETRKKKSTSMKKRWQDPKFAKRVLEAQIAATPFNSPNKTELRVLTLLDKLFPSEYKFVGNGQLIIGSRCPDFANCNGEKKLIEYDSEFWHKKNRIVSERTADVRRKMHFAKYGYETCIVHERELLGSEARLKSKLVKFQKS